MDSQLDRYKQALERSMAKAARWGWPLGETTRLAESWRLIVAAEASQRRIAAEPPQPPIPGSP